MCYCRAPSPNPQQWQFAKKHIVVLRANESKDRLHLASRKRGPWQSCPIGASKPQGWFFPTCQVRVVRFYVSCLPSSSCFSFLLLSSVLNYDHLRQVFPAGPQSRPFTPSVPCPTSITTIHSKYSPPDLNHDHPRPVSPRRTSTTTIHAPDLNRDHPRPVFRPGPQPRPSTPSVPR